MNKRKPHILIILICGLFVSCTGKLIQNGDIELSQFLIQNVELPAEWSLESRGYGIDEDRSFDSTRGLYYFGRDILSQEVYRHRSIKAAEKDFAEMVAWSGYTPEDWVFISLHADESFIFCVIYPDQKDACIWIARYENIVIDILGHNYPESSTINEMEQIAKLVDAKAILLILSEQD